MSNQQAATVYFNDGAVKESDYIYVAAKLHSVEQEETDFSRLFIYYRGAWTHHDLNWRVESVCYYSEMEAFCALSVHGEVNIATTQGFQVEQIPGAGLRDGLAAVNQIRQIGSCLYVCGDQGQVYRRDKSGWSHIDDGLLDENISADALCLNSIDGLDENDLYAVGDRGRIFHFNGRSWSELDSPTNQHLERVVCCGAGETYVCGNNGVFLKISPEGILDFSLEGMDSYFWGLECFQDKVFLASLEGLFVFDGAMVSPLSTGLNPDIGGYRLAAGDGVLWSFGVDDLASFDGNDWTRYAHPDNP